jgi:hypothetical protein
MIGKKVSYYREPERRDKIGWIEGEIIFICYMSNLPITHYVIISDLKETENGGKFRMLDIVPPYDIKKVFEI